ncbi:MAG: hypothetical protein WCV92_04385 [Candidatus Buchananbacteria bacterium]
MLLRVSINKDRTIVITKNDFPLLEGENVIFTSNTMKSKRKIAGGAMLYDLNGTYVVITNRRVVISQGPAWIKYSLFFDKNYFDSIITNQLLVDKFEYNSEIAIFDSMIDHENKIEIITKGNGRITKFLGAFSDFLNIKLSVFLWDFKDDDKKIILETILRYQISV